MPGASIARPVMLRLTLEDPPPGVPWAVQLGRTDLLPPASVSRDRVAFEVPLELVASSTGAARLRGPAVQGPSGGKFVYVNSGTRAGAAGSPWDRRAKVPLTSVSLMSVPLDELARGASRDAVVLYGEIAGTSKDGGPACASVRLLRGAWATTPRSP